MRRAAAGLVLVLACGLAGCGAESEPGSAPPAEDWRSQVFDRAYAVFRDDPVFVAKIAGQPRSAVNRIVADLARSGLMRLEDESLLRRAEIYSGALEAADLPICALLARGATPEEQTNVGVLLAHELKRPELEEWAEITALAILAELHQLPARRPTAREAQTALDDAFAPLSPEERERMVVALGNAFEVSDREICWAGRRLYRALRELPSERAAELARVLALS
ncbi:MAG: hypothetical protein ACE5IL_02880 [Myxococcota bacterium]